MVLFEGVDARWFFLRGVDARWFFLRGYMQERSF